MNVPQVASSAPPSLLIQVLFIGGVEEMWERGVLDERRRLDYVDQGRRVELCVLEYKSDSVVQFHRPDDSLLEISGWLKAKTKGSQVSDSKRQHRFSFFMTAGMNICKIRIQMFLNAEKIVRKKEEEKLMCTYILWRAFEWANPKGGFEDAPDCKLPACIVQKDSQQLAQEETEDDLVLCCSNNTSLLWKNNKKKKEKRKHWEFQHHKKIRNRMYFEWKWKSLVLRNTVMQKSPKQVCS